VFQCSPQVADLGGNVRVNPDTFSCVTAAR
jgi:hypothetical protein